MSTVLRVVIADDEPLARDCIRLALASEADVEIVAECRNGEEAAAEIERLAPDLIFLDVQMPGLDGIGTVERVGPDRMPPVVFVTAYNEHAVRAFELHAMDYVLKPFDDARIRAALERARRQLRLTHESELGRRLAALVRELDPSAARLRQADVAATAATASGAPPGDAAGYITRVLVRSGNRSHFVAVTDADYFEAAGNYVRVHSGGRCDLVRTTLASLGGRLDPSKFARIHRSTIVNLARVREVHPWFGGDYVARLTDGRELKVSRSYREALLRPLS